uniref:Uncharacterized protein n=1 Tax=Eubacterium plexicaudatum ASF492 TaxID=1235802 RepID=N2BKR2_9FIRM
MTVRPVHLNGMIQNTQDVSTIRHQENQRPAVEQQHIQIREEQKEQSKAQEVNKKDNADKEQKKYDAKEKGSNEYLNQRQKKKKEKKENLPDGSVKIKQTMSSGFDIKI